MASHIATEEWQSFELRMRHRRAERMLARAEAALDNGHFEDASAAVDEARGLCPSLAALDDVAAKVARASARAQTQPIASRVRRSFAVAAGLVLVAASGVIGWRAMSGPPAAPETVAAAPAPQPVAAPPSAPPVPPSIKVETRQVPPVVISGPAADPQGSPPSAPLATARTQAASVTTPAPPPVSSPAARPEASTVGTSGATAAAIHLDMPPLTAADTGEIVALGRETSVPAPAAPAGLTHPVSEPPASAPKTPDDADLVRGILARYADAYTRLDADAAKAVWPSVNRAALSRAFSGLNEQRIAFKDCSVDVRSAEARATCSGSTTWEPKIGGGARTDMRRWAFDLRKNGDAWIIRDARVQNR
jgi:hypothetical protein